MKRIIITTLVSLFLIVSRSARAGAWTIVATPNAGKGANNLLGVAAIADNDV
ncbi:MAG: hypothetical protein ACR2II_03965 [Chthoniobacterales bacterium]